MILEKLYRIHTSDHGYLEIGYEPDCVDTQGPIVEIRSCYYNEDRKQFDITDRVALDVKSVPALVEALTSFIKPTEH